MCHVPGNENTTVTPLGVRTCDQLLDLTLSNSIFWSVGSVYFGEQNMVENGSPFHDQLIFFKNAPEGFRHSATPTRGVLRGGDIGSCPPLIYLSLCLWHCMERICLKNADITPSPRQHISITWRPRQGGMVPSRPCPPDFLNMPLTPTIKPIIYPSTYLLHTR